MVKLTLETRVELENAVDDVWTTELELKEPLVTLGEVEVEVIAELLETTVTLDDMEGSDIDEGIEVELDCAP